DAVLPLVDDGLTGPAEATPGGGLAADAGTPAHGLIRIGPGDRRAVGDRAGSVEGSGRVAPEHRDAPYRSPGSAHGPGGHLVGLTGGQRRRGGSRGSGGRRATRCARSTWNGGHRRRGRGGRRGVGGSVVVSYAEPEECDHPEKGPGEHHDDGGADPVVHLIPPDPGSRLRAAVRTRALR